ncbi:MAG: hypothetical protein QOG54_852 [Actinomycetota bacterium]|jgi:hypothetical protein|nr:hypothetical protein [Actinomycetota bacterium]
MSRPRLAALIVAVVLVLTLVPGLGEANSTPEWTGVEREWNAEPRSQVPEDRYAMAGGCYAVRAFDGTYVARTSDGFAPTATDVANAEPFHFQATDLGSYLLFGTAKDYLAASEGVVGEAVYGVTRSLPGQIAGGVALEQTDAVADAVAESPVNKASGRGDSVVAAAEANKLADWVVDEADGGGFTFFLPVTGQALGADGGDLLLSDGGTGTPFDLELTTGCATFPELEVNVDGPLLGGANAFQEVRGFMDAHLHMMAFEFLGGRARCGRPWHRYGVERALVDCPDHQPGGRGAVLEAVLSHGNPGDAHDTNGWPTFSGWPRHDSLTHEQAYYKWLERAWRGGLRMFTNLLVDNNQLCKLYPYKRNSCNEMDGVRLQAQRIHELERYIDAQSGGPGEGWFRIVDNPFQAREVINQGKLAVVLGIEVSVPLDCGETQGIARCNEADVTSGLDEVWDLGVRQMELVNKFDNAFSGVAGDGGTTGVVVNQGNLGETGHYWKMDTCPASAGPAHDNRQINFQDDSGAPPPFSERDSLAGGVFAVAGTSGAVPVYPKGPHCNVAGLTDLGKVMITAMAEKGMLFDPDHMSASAQTAALDLVEDLDYSGVVSSHSWSNDTIYPRIYKLGGVVTPYAGDSAGFVDDWRKLKAWADDRFYFGFGYGSDVNGFGAQGGPRSGNSSNPVQYPFTGFGGVTVSQQHSGPRAYDINTDGVAHYGLYPDWLEDLRVQAGNEIMEDMARGPEAYLQMWERALGISGDACRSDIADLTDEQVGTLQLGMTPRQVMETLGQPSTRVGENFTFCMTDTRTATLWFTPDGSLAGWNISAP